MKLLPILILVALLSLAQTHHPAPDYHIYAGNTHSHTVYTWSHGEQFVKNDCGGIQVYGPSPISPLGFAWTDGYVKSKSGCAGIYVINSFQYVSPSAIVKPDWPKFQGPPSQHYAIAKANGYDFYTTSDHSQEAIFQPADPNNPAWAASKKEAAEATTSEFVALPGFEYSENDGPGGTGHINVINSAGMLNALAPGIDLPYFYKWLATAKPNGDGPVVATFNHPTPDQYNNWDYRDPKVTGIITMLEVINSNNKIHYPGYLNALAHGWKVSPVCGNDNHGLSGITRQNSRTFVLASARTKAAILDAMKNRRTYASLDKDIQCRYSVNGSIMGSTLDHPQTFAFDIKIDEPETSNPKAQITKIDIVKDGGEVAQSYTPAPGYQVEWRPTLTDSTSHFFFVRVWNVGGGDAPIAWLAPVWTGR